MYWRQLTFAAVILLVFEGALRKWVMPEAQAALYFAKDLLLMGAYLGFGLTRGFALPTRKAHPYVVLIALAAFYGLLEMFNPALPSLTLALVGWRAYFLYVPLLFMVPHLFDSPDDLERMLGRYVLLALPAAALGVMQFFSPIDSPLNANVQHEPGGGAAIGFGDIDNRVRVAGSFAFISGYSSYLMTVAFLVCALLAGNGWRIRGNVTYYLGLIVIIAAMFATGSRAPVYTLIGALALYALFAAYAGDLSFGAALQACIGAALLAAAIWYFLPEPATAFYHRANETEDTIERLTSPILEPFTVLGEAGPFGFGIGAAHQAAASLTESEYSWWTNGLVVEGESSKVMLELGVFGFLLIFLFRIAITLHALRVAFDLKSRKGRALGLLLTMFFGSQITGAVIFNPTMDVLYWFAVGLLFALTRFDELDAWEARNQHIPPTARSPTRPTVRRPWTT